MAILLRDRNVILDTCILQYLNDSLIGPQLTELLTILTRQNNKFYFSDFSTYELFRECPKDKETQLDAVWNRFTRYQVDGRVTRFAAQLASAYKTYGLGTASINDGDRMIAATTIITKSLILTADSNDFPRPFFKENHIQEIYYKKKDRKTLLMIYLLEPYYEAINYYHERRS